VLVIGIMNMLSNNLCLDLDFFRFFFSGVPIEEMDTNILFEKFTIEEIRAIEKKTR